MVNSSKIENPETQPLVEKATKVDDTEKMPVDVHNGQKKVDSKNPSRARAQKSMVGRSREFFKPSAVVGRRGPCPEYPDSNGVIRYNR